jgi:rubrerythrin
MDKGEQQLLLERFEPLIKATLAKVGKQVQDHTIKVAAQEEEARTKQKTVALPTAHTTASRVSIFGSDPQLRKNPKPAIKFEPPAPPKKKQVSWQRTRSTNTELKRLCPCRRERSAASQRRTPLTRKRKKLKTKTTKNTAAAPFAIEITCDGCGVVLTDKDVRFECPTCEFDV